MSYAGEGGERSGRLVGAGDAARVEFRSGTVGRLVAPGSTTDGRYGLFRWDMPARTGGAEWAAPRKFRQYQSMRAVERPKSPPPNSR